MKIIKPKQTRFSSFKNCNTATTRSHTGTCEELLATRRKGKCQWYIYDHVKRLTGPAKTIVRAQWVEKEDQEETKCKESIQEWTGNRDGP